MLRRFAIACSALTLSLTALSSTKVAVSAEAASACGLVFFDSEGCPADVDAFCIANQTYPCPSPNWTYWDGYCDAAGTSWRTECHYH